MRESAREFFDHHDLNCRVSGVRVSRASAPDTRDEESLNALAHRLAGRGFGRAVEHTTKDMVSMEEEARTLSPAHYRWDEMCTDGRGANFRHGTYQGRQVMDVDDFAAYFETCRTRRPLAETEKSMTTETAAAVVPARTREQSSYSNQAKQAQLKERRAARGEMADRLVAVAKDWLRPDDPATRRRGSRRALPISMLSVLVVITVSLMLIVSSTVMVATAKRDVSNLGDEVAALEKESELLTDRLESEIDYLEIYRIATEQYGMIPAEFVNSFYVDRLPENTIERLEEEKEANMGLATLLSAIGIRLGES